MYIGNVYIKNKVILGPMAGISNSAFRRICKEMGAGLVVAEMVSDKALYYGSKKTEDMLYMTEEERPISQQIFGSDEESLIIATKYIINNMHPDIIDFNCGCPMPKVTKTGSGSALLKDPEKLEKLVKIIVETSNVPVTVKIRSGWDHNSINAIEIAKRIERAGASAITVHPRTRNDLYSGHSDWSIIKKVKENVNIPVIGNGDIKSPIDAKKMLDETGCDAIMICRGALGNPWLIRDTVKYLEDGTILKEPTYQEKIDMIKKHLSYLLIRNNEESACKQMRMHVSHYLKGMPKNKEIKDKIFKVITVHDFLKILDDYEQEIGG